MIDILEPLQLQKKCSAWYIFTGASKTSEKCVGHSGTLGVFQKSYKNIYKIDRQSAASTTSEKCVGHPATLGVFQKS